MISFIEKRVVQMFQKRNSYSDSSRGTSTQTIVNEIPRAMQGRGDGKGQLDRQ